MENTQLVINPKDFGLDEKKVNELTNGLQAIIEERNVLIDNYKTLIVIEATKENLSMFKELRLKIRDNRTKGIEKWHKVNKEFFLTGGRFVDAIKNKEVAENERMEEKLDALEKHFENLEKERLKQIHLERVEKISKFNYEIGTTDFSLMDENMFGAILLGAETKHKEDLEKARLAELARLEAIRLEEEEKAKQKAELERLRLENEAKEKELKEQKAKADAELAEQQRLAKIEADKQAEILRKQKEESDRIASELKAKADAEAKKANDIIEAQRKKLEAERESARQAALEVERLAKEKAAAELKAKQEAEKLEAERLEALKQAELAPDKEKLTKWLNSLSTVAGELKVNGLQNQDAIAVSNLINQKFEGFKKWALEQITNIK